jgi:hypothetical protein
MEENVIIRYSPNQNQKVVEEFENAIYDSLCKYSFRHLPFSKKITEEIIHEALQKSIQICQLAGVNSQYHFKKMFVYEDQQHHIIIDWKMSKKAVNLMVTQMKQPDRNTAQWIWKLIDV